MCKTKMLVIVIVLLAGAPVLAQDDVADVPSERIELKGKQVYFLIGADAKEQKPRPLLLVLPGGDGSEEFNGFVKRMWKNALPKEFVVAQLVAVSSDKPQQIIWPTARVKDAKQDFSTESFVADVVADVGKRVKIDRERVYALGWSSSGPALYTMAATPNTPVKGYFIAMSVFRANIVVNQQALKGKKVFLYHSPEDQMCPMRMAKEGEAALTKAGAKVKFVEYQGGHGWRGNVFGDIRAGVEWLEKKEAGK